MATDENRMDSLIAGGLIGAALGAFLSKDKEEGALAGALLGAAIAATAQASEAAKNSKVPFLLEEQGKLYEVQPSGEKRFVKNISKPSRQLPDTFKLK